MDLPQRAVLSLLLYATYTSDLCQGIKEKIKVVQFADDIAIYIRGHNRQKNREMLETAVNIIAKNLEEIGLDLQPNKTELVEFSSHGKTDKNMFIYIRDTKIYNKKEVKFLDV